ncbi:MAG: NAD(P)/FAD-dependent oxidoreductase [Candidatus Uhrbacteria bacterium]|nr:NAD(P)/FAD-dependent oxidoreductase [Candidatus Uhrbacteria bacterium]
MKTRILIVGGGFVGLRVAQLLSRRCNGYEVMLVDKKREFLFTPWLVDAFAGEIKLENVTVGFPELAKQDGFTFLQVEALYVDRAAKRVRVARGEKKEDIPYDLLVLSHGARTCYYGIPGAQEYSFPLKNPQDDARAQDAILETLAKASKTKGSERERLLSMAVVGAGPTGIESVFAIKQFIERGQKEKKIDAELKPRFHLIQGAPQILPGFPDAVVRHANAELDRQGMQTLTGEAVTKVEPGLIHTVSGKTIPTSFILWSAGIEPCPIEIRPPVVTEHGGYPAVDNYFRLDPSIFSAGDVSGFRMKGAPVPKTAQTAMQMAPVLAKNILRTLAGKKLVPFRTSQKGVVITLGDTGVISLKHALTMKTKLAIPLRNLYYLLRFKQMTKR